MKAKKVRKKRKLGSYPFVSVVFSITVALCVFGLFGWILLVSNNLGTQIEEKIQLQVYLNKNLSQPDINFIQSTILSRPYVLIKEETPQVNFTTKEQAAQAFIESSGEDFKEFLGDNPLRDFFQVNVRGDYQSLDSLSLIKAEIEGLRGVFEVVYEENLIEQLNKNTAKIGFVLFGICLFALLVVIILINNTIKLALFSQRFLIRSMQLVGATPYFIKKPFLVRSALFGFLSGLLACATLYGFTQYMNGAIEGLGALQDLQSFLVLYALIVFIGIAIGYLSSLRAVSKYLKMSLDELY